MKFLIITHVPHIKKDEFYFAYSPYVREMNIWGNGVSQISIVAPLKKEIISAIHLPYSHQEIIFKEVTAFSLTSIAAIFKALLILPKSSWQIYKAMQQADHIHLRCPGNIGLLGCIVQILFPNKQKTAKYAGNWDPKSKQPLTYKLQKYILSSAFLTKNMQVLVYGEWEGSTKNIKPFFTATYSNSDKLPISKNNLNSGVYLVFVGTLVRGKNPLYAIKVVEALYKKGYNVVLTLYGEGIERKNLEDYILKNNLEKVVFLKGNQSQNVIQKVYEYSHFVILPSESEGWPKAVAEGMFWGCVPIATSVSCVPFMLDQGNRGILLKMNLENDTLQIETIIKNKKVFADKSQKSSDWSRYYTMDVFEDEINKLLKS